MSKRRYRVLALLIVSAMYLMLCGYTEVYDDSQEKVYDQADLFTAEEEENLQNMCVYVAKKTKLDVAVVTTDDAEGKTSMVYADDFYDRMIEENGFGYDNGASGIILLIDMDNREIYISTAGIAIQYFNDEDIEDILSNLDDYMASELYYNAAKTFVNDVDSHAAYINRSYYKDVEPWFEGDYTDYKDFEKDMHKTIFAYPLVDLLIAVVVSAVIVCIMAYNAGAKMTADGSNYMNKDEFKIRSATDVYLRTTVTKQKIESSSGGGSGHSGGSSHRSSSGRSHGGGGHKF